MFCCQDKKTGLLLKSDTLVWQPLSAPVCQEVNLPWLWGTVYWEASFPDKSYFWHSLTVLGVCHGPPVILLFGCLLNINQKAWWVGLCSSFTILKKIQFLFVRLWTWGSRVDSKYNRTITYCSYLINILHLCLKLTVLRMTMQCRVMGWFLGCLKMKNTTRHIKRNSWWLDSHKPWYLSVSLRFIQTLKAYIIRRFFLHGILMRAKKPSQAAQCMCSAHRLH